VPIQPHEITPGTSLTGIEPDLVVQVVAAVPVGEAALTLIYRLPEGSIRERLLTAADFSTNERPWSLAGDGIAFKPASFHSKC
jgi:hypothetical protein